MRTTTEEATAAPMDVDFGNGNVYKMSPMRDIDSGELLNWVRNRYCQVAAEGTKGLPPEEKAAVIAAVAMKAAGITRASEDFFRVCLTLEGLAKMLQISFSQHHPDLTEADILLAMINDPTVADEASRVHKMLNAASDPPPKKKITRAGVKKAKRKKRKKTGV